MKASSETKSEAWISTCVQTHSSNQQWPKRPHKAPNTSPFGLLLIPLSTRLPCLGETGPGMRQTVDCTEAPRVPRSLSSRKRQRPPRTGLPLQRQQSEAPRGIRWGAACTSLFPARAGSESGGSGRKDGRTARGNTVDAAAGHRAPREGAADHSAGGPGPPQAWGRHQGFRRASKERYFQETPPRLSELWRTALLTVATRDRTCTLRPVLRRSQKTGSRRIPD